MKNWIKLVGIGLVSSSTNSGAAVEPDEIMISEYESAKSFEVVESFCIKNKCLAIKMKFDKNDNIESIRIGKKSIEISKLNISRKYSPQMEVSFGEMQEIAILKIKYGNFRNCNNNKFSRDYVSLVFSQHSYIENLKYENCKLVPL